MAPSPTGYLHLGHARTFWIACERAKRAGGSIFLRCDDLDRARCRPLYVEAMKADLEWLGLSWQPPLLFQSERMPLYREALGRLHAAGLIYPCNRSRRDVLEALGAPHEGPGGEDEEPVYPLSFRPRIQDSLPALEQTPLQNWRFRVPEGETLAFIDARMGPQSAQAGIDFGDFLVWRKDGLPSYQLASVVDDSLLGISEVVRGADLIKSTFRQLLLFRALDWEVPTFYHCDLMRDGQGVRLAKRHDALSLRALRAQGKTPEELIAGFSGSA